MVLLFSVRYWHVLPSQVILYGYTQVFKIVLTWFFLARCFGAYGWLRKKETLFYFLGICQPKANYLGKCSILFATVLFIGKEWLSLFTWLIKHRFIKTILFSSVIENRWKYFLIIAFCWVKLQKIVCNKVYTAWNVSKYGAIFGPQGYDQNTVRNFPVFGLNTEIYRVNPRIQSEYRKIRTRNNSIFGHFSHSDSLFVY